MARQHAKLGKSGSESVAVSSIEEAISSKSWASRKHGYEALANIFKNLDPRSPNWERLTYLIDAVVEERNIPALEKGLEAALLFVQICATVSEETAKTLLTSAVGKCIADPKPRIRELATQICIKLFEKNKSELVLVMLLEGLEKRNAKQAFACVRTLTSMLSIFGPKLVDVGLITPKIVSLCVNKSFFQQEVKDLLIAIYTFIGPNINEQLYGLDSSQMKTMEIEFAKIDERRAEKVMSAVKSKHESVRQPSSICPTIQRPESTKSVKTPSSSAHQRPSSTRHAQKTGPERVLSPRSEKQSIPSAKKKEESGGCGDRFSPRSRNARGGVVHPRIGFDDIFTLIESKQWGDRKDALEEILKVMNSDKTLGLSSYNKIIKCLRNVILNDTNVLLISKAVQCVTAMAKKEDNEFRQHAPLMMTLLLEKFKERKNVLVEAIREATDAIYSTSSFATIHRYVSLSLEHQNPAVKSETELFLSRCYLNPNPEMLRQAHWQPLVANLVKNLTFQDQSVRQNATKALGVMMRAIGEQNMAPHLRNVQRHHLNSISAFCDEAVVEYRQPNSSTISYHSDGSIDTVDLLFNNDVSRVKALSAKSGGRSTAIFMIKETEGPQSDPDSEDFEFNHSFSQSGTERFYDAQEPTGVDGQHHFDKGSKVRFSSLTTQKGSRESSQYVEVVKTKTKSAKTQEETRQSRSRISNDPSISSRRKSRSPAAEEKLNALRTTIEQLRKKSDFQSSICGSEKRNIEKEVATKLENLENNVDTCFEEIRALSPLLYDEITGSASFTAESPMVLREFNNKLGRMERLLKSMAFDENRNKERQKVGGIVGMAVIKQGNGSWFVEGGF